MLSQDDSLTNWSDESDSRLFITSILHKALNVKDKKKNRVRKWLKVNRLQLPLPNHHTNPATNSIPKPKGKVKTFYEIH